MDLWYLNIYLGESFARKTLSTLMSLMFDSPVTSRHIAF